MKSGGAPPQMDGNLALGADPRARQRMAIDMIRKGSGRQFER
jgi:hypothetical protein